MRQVFLLIPAVLLLFRFSPFIQGGGFSMQVLLYILLFVCSVGMAVQVLRHPRRITVAVSKAEAAVMGFFGTALGLIGLSAVTSWSPVTSFFGVNGQDFISFTFLFGLFVYLVAALLFVEKEERRMMVRTVGWGLGAALIIDLASYAHAGKLLLADGPVEFGLLGALSLPLVYWLLRRESRIDMVSGAVLGLASLTALVVVDLTIVWSIVLILAIGVAAGYLAEDRSHRLLAGVPALFAAFAVILLIFDPVIGSGLAPEVAPGTGLTWEVAKESLGTTRVFLGHGPGTFSLVYDAYRPENVASSSFWNVRFAGSESFFLTALITFGVLPVLAALVAIVVALGGGWIRLKNRLKGLPGKGSIEAEVLLVGVLLALFLTPIAPSVVILGLVAVLWIFIEQTSQSEVTLSRTWMSPKLISLSVVVLLFLGLLIHGLRLFSEQSFASAIKAQHAQSIQETRSAIDSAASLMPINDAMYRNLAYGLLLNGVEELSKETPDDQLAARYFALSIDAAQKATRLSPKLATNWSMLGDIYSELIPVDAQAIPLAIESYEVAVRRAPTNPAYHLELAKLYLLNSNALASLEPDQSIESQRQLAIDSAQEHLVRAQELRPQLAGVSYYLAQVYQQRGDLERATETLERAYAETPKDSFVAMQYGIVLLENGSAEEARDVLEKLVEQDPTISNARWYLAYAYEQTGSLDLALEQLEQIRLLNPENVELLKRIEEVRSQTVPFGPELPEPIVEG